MSTRLHRLRPKPGRANVQESHRSADGQSCIDKADVQPLESQQTRPFRLSHLQRLRSLIDALILKVDARECLEQNGRERYASRIQCDDDYRELLSSVEDWLTSHKSESSDLALEQTPSRQAEDVRVRLRLTRRLAQILMTLQASGLSTSQHIEALLWESGQIKDAASLMNISRPKALSVPAA